MARGRQAAPPRVAGKDVGGVGGGMGPPSLRQQDVNSNSQSSSSAPFFFLLRKLLPGRCGHRFLGE